MKRPVSKHTRPVSTQPFSLVSQVDLDLRRETEYIIGRAQQNYATVVTISHLVFFSTQAGDAWILDREERCALCLMWQGEVQSYDIRRTSEGSRVSWPMNYRLEKGDFVLTGGPNEALTIENYPPHAILDAIDSQNHHRRMAAKNTRQERP